MEFGRVLQTTLVMAVAIGIVVVTYATRRLELSGRDRFLLIALRTLVVLLIGFCLLDPSGIVVRTEPVRSQVAVLLDRSASMDIEDHPSANGVRRRWDVAEAATRRLTATLSDRFDVRSYTFDGVLHATVSGEPIGPQGPDGQSTDVLGSLASAMDRARGAPLAGVVLVTDGGQNVGTLRMPGEHAAPVFVVAVGDPSPPKDVAVVSLSAEPFLFLGERAVVRAAVRATGYPGRRLSPTLSADGSLIGVAAVDTAAGVDHGIEFEFTPAIEGSIRLEVAVSPQVDEVTDVNNRRAVTVQVLRSRTRVLLLDGTPRHEFAFLRRTLSRLDSVELTATVLATPNVPRDPDSLPARRGTFSIGSESLALPSDPTAAPTYDVVIIGDVALSLFSAGQRDWLLAFVETHGKGIAWLAGEQWLTRRLGVGALERILPVSVPPSGARLHPFEFAPVVTQEGRYHPVTHLGTSLDESERIWDRMPLWSRLYTGLTAKRGSTVLVSGGDGDDPVIVYRHVGLGKSLLVATDATWRWGFGSALLGQDTPQRTSHSVFWTQVIRWLATPSDARQVTLALGNMESVTGEALDVAIRVYDTGLLPATKASVQLTHRQPDGHATPVPVTESVGTPGLYHASVPLTQEGAHELRATATVRGVPSSSGPVRFDVTNPHLELMNVARGDALLRSLADASGGSFHTADDFTAIPALLSDHAMTREVRVRRALWDHPIVFAGILTFLTIEWAHRRRKGLV